MIRVKVCGITGPEDALTAASAGADAIGLIFAPESRRCVTTEGARAITAALPPFVTPVGVFVNEPRERITQIAETCGLGALQLHGEEPPEACRGWSLPVVKVFRVGADFDPEVLARYHGCAFLLDAALPGARGGTGTTCDWDRAADAVAHGPVILSGGLGPENVGEAIARVGPYGVDASSGLERAPGVKDPDKVRAFVTHAKGWELDGSSCGRGLPRHAA
jgi:phosphoribosylanthranilate isomerase